MARKRLTEPQLWQLRRAVAENGCAVLGSSGTRLANTLAKLGLATYDSHKSWLHPTNYGRTVAERDGYME